MDNPETKNKITHSDLISYYEIRMAALSEYSDRVWNRFNWFLTLELSTFGFFLSQLEKAASQPLLGYGIPIIAIIVSSIWALMGAEDYISMKKHGKIVTKLEEYVKDIFLQQGFNFEVSIQRSFLNFRQTSLLFLFPIFLEFLWLAIIIQK